MNGVSLLLALSALGPVFTSRTGIDKQQEYVLQIEQEVIPELVAGSKIESDLRADAGPFARMLIAILPKDGQPVRHTLAGEEQFRQLLLPGRYASRDRASLISELPLPILWTARAAGPVEQSAGVTTGWEPDVTGRQQYIVQIDPTIFSALALGDELYVPIDPAAGPIVRFIVKAGREPLAHVGGPAAGTRQSPAAPGYAQGEYGRGRYAVGSEPAGSAWNNQAVVDYAKSQARPDSGPSAAWPYDSRNSPVAAAPPAGYAPPLANAGNYDSYRGYAPRSEPNAPPGYFDATASQPPNLQPPPRASTAQYPETRVAGLPPTTAQASIVPGLGVAPVATTRAVDDKPWGPLLFVTFALFFSIGGNLYLAYTALEFHTRYRNAIERLRSAARSS